jgi:hypothetical protein
VPPEIKEIDMANIEEWAKALSQRLAGRDISDQAVQTLAEDVSKIEFNAIGVDICTIGFCVDYLIDHDEIVPLIDQLRGSDKLGGIRIFPKGIIDPDQFLVRVETALAH